MKLRNLSLLLGLTLSTTACIAPTGNYNFDSSMLSPQIYNKYWAMEEQDDIANVMQITPDGLATLWRYSCDKLNDYETKNKGTIGQLVENIDKDTPLGKLAREFIKVERHKLETIGRNKVRLNVLVVGGWSTLEFSNISSTQINGSQTMLGVVNKNFTYHAVPSFTQPRCAN